MGPVTVWSSACHRAKGGLDLVLRVPEVGDDRTDRPPRTPRAELCLAKAGQVSDLGSATAAGEDAPLRRCAGVACRF